jgi:hypothetical protein
VQRPRIALAAGVLAGALGLIGCSGDGNGADCPAARPATEVPGLASDIRSDRFGVVTAGQEADGFTTLTLDSDLSVDELVDRLPGALAPLGLRQLTVEDEGFEAEIYFAADDDASSAVARVRESTTCEGRTTVQLSVSDDRPAPSTSGSSSSG